MRARVKDAPSRSEGLELSTLKRPYHCPFARSGNAARLIAIVDAPRFDGTWCRLRLSFCHHDVFLLESKSTERPCPSLDGLLQFAGFSGARRRKSASLELFEFLRGLVCP